MWESPIRILQTQLATELEGEVLKAVCKYGVAIDKDKLLELLQNDRNSYDLGYRDGKKEVCERILLRLEEEYSRVTKPVLVIHLPNGERKEVFDEYYYGNRLACEKAIEIVRS